MKHLPYQDSKPQGAADFYFAINATFRFMVRRFGHDGFVRWLREMGRDYFATVNRQWRDGGLPAVAAYWREFFDAEPGADVDVHEEPALVTIRVHRCPAIAHLRGAGRTVAKEFCEHCYFLNQSRAEESLLSMTVEGGNGACVHRYAPRGVLVQGAGKIREVV